MYQPERKSRRKAVRPTAPRAPVIGTGPGVFGIGSYRQGQAPSANVAPPKGGGSGGFFGNIGDIANSVVGMAKKYGGQASQQLQQTLDQMVSPAGSGGLGGVSDADLMAQARAEASAQFGPQIAALNSAMAQAKSQTGYNKSAIDSLYDQLAATYAGDIKESKQSFKEAKSTEKKLSTATRKDIGASYSEGAAELSKQMQDLGIEAAAPDVLPGLSKDKADYLASEAERSAVEQSAYGREGTAEQAYFQRGPSLARMGSAEGQSALTEQLNQYLMEQQGQKAMAQSQQSLTYNALLGKYRQQAAQQAYQQQQDQFAQSNTVFDNQLALKKFQYQQSQDANRVAKPPQLAGLSGAANVLGGYTQQRAGGQPDVAGSSKLMQDLQAAMAVASQKGINSNDYGAQLQNLRDFAQKMGISPNDIAQLQNALAAFLGKY